MTAQAEQWHDISKGMGMGMGKVKAPAWASRQLIVGMGVHQEHRHGRLGVDMGVHMRTTA